MVFLGLLLAVFMGLALGLLGGGGSILAVPILVYVLGFGAKEAVAVSLVVVGVTSLFGAAEHWREGRVRLRVALIFGSLAAGGGVPGGATGGLLERRRAAFALRHGDVGCGLLYVPRQRVGRGQ